MSERTRSLGEQIVVDAAFAEVHRVVSDLRNVGRWSPECRRAGVARPPARQPVRRAGPEGERTRVTETWQDLRTGRGSRLTVLLGAVFAGTGPDRRIAVNRAGMRTTLARLAAGFGAVTPPRP